MASSDGSSRSFSMGGKRSFVDFIEDFSQLSLFGMSSGSLLWSPQSGIARERHVWSDLFILANERGCKG